MWDKLLSLLPKQKLIMPIPRVNFDANNNKAVNTKRQLDFQGEQNAKILSSFTPKTVQIPQSLANAGKPNPALFKQLSDKAFGTSSTPKIANLPTKILAPKVITQPKVLPTQDVRQLVAKQFPEDPKTAQGIAMQESSLRPTARNTIPSRGIDAIGLMQINLPAHLDKVPGKTYEDKAKNLMNPIINLRVARQIYNDSKWNPWEAFTSGAYRRYVK